MTNAPSGSHDIALPINPFPAAPRIVGLSGLAGCGKSTVAAYLVRAHGYTRIRFADPLKKAMAAIGCTPDEIEGHLKEVPSKLLCGQTPRFAMQTIGTEWGRNTIGQDLWVNAWKRAVDSLPAHARIVADDCRFPNEAVTLRSYGGLIFEIVRPGQTKIATSGHASESFAFDADGQVPNEGTLAQLYRAVDYRILRDESLPKEAA